MIPSGVEPETYTLEVCCSIQLSYGTGMEGTENPNTNIYISTSRPNKHIDDYSIEELQNIISNKKTEKLRHEAHVLRITNLELYNFIIDEHFYNKYSGPSHTDEYNYDSGY